jgi:hypothetical protein
VKMERKSKSKSLIFIAVLSVCVLFYVFKWALMFRA